MLGIRQRTSAAATGSTALGSKALGSAPGSTSSGNDFATALQSALADGTLGGDGTLGEGGSAASTLKTISNLLNGSLSGAGASGLSGSAATGGTGTGAAAMLAAIARLADVAAKQAGADAPVRTSADVGAQAVTLAAKYTGVPYRWGGEDPATGVDCSGLTQHVYGELGVTLPRVAEDQAKVGKAIASVDDAQPGDLVFFGTPAHHVGIYVGDNKMIDAPHSGATVGVHPLWGTPSAIRRVATVSVADRSAATVVAAQDVVATPSVTAPAATSGTAGVGGPYASLFATAGRKYGVDPALLSAVAKAESAYNPRAVSSAGAQGLMQLMPSTARSLGVDPYDPASAVDGAARLMSQLLDRFGGRVDLALAGYNAGPGAVQRYGGVPPYPETQTYVRRVTQYWEDLR
jgi:cell wall-associated NlpC family hydrolase